MGRQRGMAGSAGRAEFSPARMRAGSGRRVAARRRLDDVSGSWPRVTQPRPYLQAQVTCTSTSTAAAASAERLAGSRAGGSRVRDGRAGG